MGSKARIAKDVAPIVQSYIDKNNIKTYIEPFVGGSNMIQHIKCENKYGYDNNKYLIEFWRALQDGWQPFKELEMTKEFYDDIKKHQDMYSPKLVALAGFCATYNAKWFGGYAGIVQTKIGTTRNYYDEAVRNVLKQVDFIKDVKYETKDYKEIYIKDTLIYCDPPYLNTTKYKDDFNHDVYWDWVRLMSKGNIVLCSEYNAPDDFECIWSKGLTTTLDKNSRKKAVEKLFTYKNNV